MRGLNWRWIGAAMVLGLFGLMISRANGMVAVGGWSTPVPVASTTGWGDYPAVVVASGKVHVAWDEQLENLSHQILYSALDAGGWSSPVWVGDGEIPALSAGPDGAVHLVWTGEYQGNFEIFYRQWTAGNGWSATVRVSDTGGLSDNPKIAVGSDNARHVVWSDTMPGSTTIYHATSKDGQAWSLSSAIPGGEGEFPNLALGDGEVHVAWVGFVPGTNNTQLAIFYDRLGDSGWDPPTIVSTSTTSLWASTPSLAVTGGGNVHLVWAEEMDAGTQVLYAQGSGTNWTTPASLSGSGYAPALALDPQGGLHVVWADLVRILYSYRAPDTGQWTDPVDIANIPSYKDLPALALDTAQNPHVVWSQLITAENQDIYYAYHTSTPGTTTPSPTPAASLSATPTGVGPTSTATASPTATPTSTATQPGATVAPSATSTPSPTATATTQASPTYTRTPGPTPAPAAWVYLPLVARK